MTNTTQAQTNIINIESSKGRWPVIDVEALFDLSFNDLLFKAQQVHRENFDPNELQLSLSLIHI